MRILHPFRKPSRTIPTPMNQDRHDLRAVLPADERWMVDSYGD